MRGRGRSPRERLSEVSDKGIMITCEKRWELICELSWYHGRPACENDEAIRKLPSWLQQQSLPFISDEDCTDMEGYIWGNHYLYRLEWKPGDCTDHLYVYRSRRVDMSKMRLQERRSLSEKIRALRKRTTRS